MKNWKDRSFKDQSHIVIVDADDQRRLKLFFLHELALYNTLIESFESRTRAFPTQISNLTDKDIELFCLLAENNLQLEDLNKEEGLPPRLMEFRVSGADKKIQINGSKDWHFLISNVLRQKLAILPVTKRMMIDSMCRFYRDQADILKDPQTSTITDVSYRATANNLAKLDATSKRHAQISRKDVIVRFDNEQDSSLVTIPLCRKPVVVPGVNLNERQGWNLMILRQEPGHTVNNDTPWIAEFKDSKNQYLLKLTDRGNKKQNRYGSSFTTSKAFT